MVLLLELIVSLGIFGFLFWQIFRTSEENLSDREKLCRSRAAGIILSLPCALLCVPLAIPVSPGFLIPLLYPVAVALPVLSYFYIDYYAARGFSFFLILLSYDMVHGAFEQHAPCGGAVTFLALLMGIAGIWIAAKPCTMRDIFRKCAVSAKWKNILLAVMALMAVNSLYLLIIMIYGVITK